MLFFTLVVEAGLKLQTTKISKKTMDYQRYFNFYSKKNSIFRTLFINGSDAEKIYFQTFSNKLTKIKTLSKKLYFQNELKKNKNNARKTWDIIKSTPPITSNRRLTNSLRINDAITEDPEIIVNEFNNFFWSIGSNLAEKRQISHLINI